MLGKVLSNHHRKCMEGVSGSVRDKEQEKDKHRKIMEFAIEMLQDEGRPLPAGVIAGEFNRKHGKHWSATTNEVANTLKSYPEIFIRVKYRKGSHPALWGLIEWSGDE